MWNEVGTGIEESEDDDIAGFLVDILFVIKRGAGIARSLLQIRCGPISNLHTVSVPSIGRFDHKIKQDFMFNSIPVSGPLPYNSHSHTLIFHGPFSCRKKHT